jgi:lysophospholipase L1-like esterase
MLVHFPFPSQASWDPSRWERDIKAFEMEDQKFPPPPDPTLFLGSSSIRLWPHLQDSFPDFDVLNRGFGGSSFNDILYYYRRIITPYQAKRLVLYSGDNDLMEGLEPAAIEMTVRQLLEALHETQDLPVLLVSVKPSPSRIKLLPKMRELNQRLQQISTENSNVDFVDVFSAIFSNDGKIRQELFSEDMLHMNEAGYRLWTSLIRPLLNAPRVFCGCNATAKYLRNSPHCFLYFPMAVETFSVCENIMQ